MADFALDTFTDTAGVVLTAHTPESGGAWVRTAANSGHNAPVVDATGGRIRGNHGGNVVTHHGTATIDGESHELVFDTVTNVGSVGVGIRMNTNGGYVALVGGGVFRLMRLVSGAYTQLTTYTVTPTVGQHTIKITALGTGASVQLNCFYDGVNRGSYSDTNAARYNTLAGAGILLGSVDSDSIGHHPTLSTGTDGTGGGGAAVLTLQTPAPGQFFPRTGSTGTPTASVAWTNTPGPIEARLVDVGTGLPLSGYDWVTVVASPTADSSSSWNASSVPQGGPYQWQVRDSLIPGTVLTSGSIFIGVFILIFGQSSALKWFTSGDSTLTPHAQLRVHGNIGTWLTPLTASMNGAIAFGNAMITARGCPVCLLDYAADGSGLFVTSNGARWVPTSSNAYTLMAAGVTAAGGKVEAGVWVQGEGDGVQNVSQSDYYTSLGTLFAAVRADFGTSITPFVLPLLARRSTAGITDSGAESIKLAQIQKGNDANIYRVERTDLPLSDGVHHTAAGYATLGTRCANALKFAWGYVSQYRGPGIASVQRVSAQVFDVTHTNRSGTDFTPISAATGYTVTDPGSGDVVIAVTSTAQQSATVNRITLASAPVGLPKVAYMWGVNPTITGVIKDNSSLALPLEYHPGVVAIEAGVPPSAGIAGKSTAQLMMALGTIGQAMYSVHQVAQSGIPTADTRLASADAAVVAAIAALVALQ